jgi:hypothetical protein
LRKSSDKGPIPRRLRFGAPQESDFQRLGKNTKRFNPAGNRSSMSRLGVPTARRAATGKAAKTNAVGESDTQGTASALAIHKLVICINAFTMS